MALIFGLDIGTTSVGFAVIEHDHQRSRGPIRRLGVRIFPEARDPKTQTPLNQERRQARLRRRQLRRRRERRRLLQELLHEARLLPAYGTSDWDAAMKCDPYDLRRRAFEGESLSPHEIGRAVYHLAQRRHFKGRDIDEISDDAEANGDDADEVQAAAAREQTTQALKRSGKTLGAWLSERGPHERKRGEHANRKIVEEEFDKLWAPRLPEEIRESVREAIFRQRPVFWRLNTLGECRFIPGAPLCPKGSWLSQQRRMLEKLNNLELAGGNQRPLDEEERAAILSKLQTQASMTWSVVRKALAPLYQTRGEPGAEKALTFNLQEGGEKKLLGNAIEKKLADILGGDWCAHPYKQEIRDAIHERIWQADYQDVNGQRVVILPERERRVRREIIAHQFTTDFGLSDTQAEALSQLKLPTGWEPYSIDALQKMLPKLDEGVRFSGLVNGPVWENWRNETFPDRVRPTTQGVERLPSPAVKEEQEYIATVRNPTVVRARNELRKVVNNLIDMFGKPDMIRVEVTRDVGLSKRQREEKLQGIRKMEGRRKKAEKALRENRIENPSRNDIEKWMLWEECGYFDPYTGDPISFEALFHRGEFEVEHIRPRSWSNDNSFGNKTLCRKDVNARKGDETPYGYIGHDETEWQAIAERVRGMKKSEMTPGKIRRFLEKRRAPEDRDGFVARQLNDTGYAAREAVAYLKQLWPDLGPNTPVNVYAVSGRVTGHLRRLWGLNNILDDTGEKTKTRDDHRHHAIDALTVACAHPGVTQKLSRYWQAKDNPSAEAPCLPLPWDTIRSDAEVAVKKIVVSHRIRKKISGPLHKDTIYGDTAQDEKGKNETTYRYFVTRKAVNALSRSELKDIRDEGIREIIQSWVDNHGGDPKKAFPPFPKRGRCGPEIRKVRLLKKQQISLMAHVSTGYADLGNNHHIAIYRLPNGVVDYEVVSLLEASRRLARREPVVVRDRSDGAQFLMSLSPGDSLRLTRNGKAKVRIVQSIWSAGPVVMVDHDDAVNATVFRPNASTIISNGGKKLSIDPIGRERPAND